MSRSIHRPSPSMVIAMTALFIALTGASYAAVKANSIGAKQIKPNGVRASEIQDGAVGSAELGNDSVGGAEVQNGAVGSGEVQDESLGSGDLQDGSLGGGDVQDGSLNGGDVEDESLGGADVARLGDSDFGGGAFLGGKVTVQFEQAAAELADGASQSYNAFCPAGQKAIGGGFRGDVTDSEATNTGSSRPSMAPTNTEPPLDDGTFSGWRITTLNPAGGVGAGILPEVWAICTAVP
jgi:hypothetical protein